LLCAQATVYLLENLDVILSKLSEDDIKGDVLPMIFSTLESNSLTLQVQTILPRFMRVKPRFSAVLQLFLTAEGCGCQQFGLL